MELKLIFPFCLVLSQVSAVLRLTKRAAVHQASANQLFNFITSPEDLANNNMDKYITYYTDYENPNATDEDYVGDPSLSPSDEPVDDVSLVDCRAAAMPTTVNGRRVRRTRKRGRKRSRSRRGAADAR